MVKQFIYRVRSIRGRARIMISVETGASSGEVWRLKWRDFNPVTKTLIISGVKGHRTSTYPISDELVGLLMQIPRTGERIFSEILHSDRMNDTIAGYRRRLAKETGNPDFLKIHFHTFRHFAISWKYFKCKSPEETKRFARHCNYQNTETYIHIVKAWIKSDEFDVVYAESKDELTKYLSEGFQLVTQTEWGYCLNRPKSLA